jgi:hypothetical protein
MSFKMFKMNSYIEDLQKQKGHLYERYSSEAQGHTIVKAFIKCLVRMESAVSKIQHQGSNLVSEVYTPRDKKGQISST